ncbi:MAG: hypothetical protein M1447_06900 [Gammaproteobacteria bacterium]|jgi:hypothetical protein|nr:hypothetical protein [Gammaproteobacteria bacterium]
MSHDAQQRVGCAAVTANPGPSDGFILHVSRRVLAVVAAVVVLAAGVGSSNRRGRLRDASETATGMT